MASVEEALEAQEIPPRAGDWLNRELHPTIRKRTLALEAEYEDSGGCWAYTDWRRHQSWSRYFVDFVQPRHWMGSVWQELPLIAFVLLLTVFAALYYDLYCIELDLRLPADSPHFVRSFFRYQTKAPGRLVLVSEGYFQPYFYLVIPLSLLLVFKTQVSYSRWWEARCVLGDQQNELRNAARLVVAWIWPKDKNLAEDIVRLIAALAPACAAFMRHETRPLDANADLLTAKELRYVISCKQPPVALGAMISKRLVAAPIETFERVAIEQNIVAFMSTLAPLIRLSTQPLYLTYTRVAVRMVILFLLGLPFALYAYMGWMTVPAVLLTTIMCATIENMATQIENPLLVLPVETLTTNTRRHVEETLASRLALEEAGV